MAKGESLTVVACRFASHVLSFSLLEEELGSQKLLWYFHRDFVRRQSLSQNKKNTEITTRAGEFRLFFKESTL